MKRILFGVGALALVLVASGTARSDEMKPAKPTKIEIKVEQPGADESQTEELGRYWRGGYGHYHGYGYRSHYHYRPYYYNYSYRPHYHYNYHYRPHYHYGY